MSAQIRKVAAVEVTTTAMMMGTVVVIALAVAMGMTRPKKEMRLILAMLFAMRQKIRDRISQAPLMHVIGG